MTSGSFYVTLPSNTHYEHNSASDFIVPFQPAIHIKKPYQVGLSEISIPNSYNAFHSLKDRSFYFSVRNINTDTYVLKSVLHIPEMFFENIIHLIENINSVISEQMKNLQSEIDISEDDFLRLEYIQRYRKIKVIVTNTNTVFEQKIRFFSYLSQILGFDKEVSYPDLNNTLSRDTVFFKNINLSIFYILLPNIVETEYVGGRKTPLLRQLVVTDPISDIIHTTFEKILYKNVVPFDIPSLRVRILDGNFDPVTFSTGTSFIVLHFKPA